MSAVTVGITLVLSAGARDLCAATPAKRAAIRRLKGIDLDGRLHRIGDSPKTRAIVFVFISTQCPVSNGYIPRLNAIAKRQGTETEFYGVISDSSVTRREACAHRKKFGIRFPILFDASGELSALLQPTHLPHAFVLSCKCEIAYSGMIDDWYAELGRKKVKTTKHYLEDAIESVTRDQVPKVSKTTPIGCLTETATPGKITHAVTFTRDIAPIVFANCTTCHRKGEAAPFPLVTYRDVARHGRQIAAVTKSRFMPPWKPMPNFGHFVGERRLSKREIALIAAWVKAGKPYGDAADLPPTPTFSTGWQLGKPDLILKMKQRYQLPAGGEDQFRQFVIPTGVAKTRLVAAVEFRPGNARVAHHASIFLDNSGTARKLDAAMPGYGYSRFGGVGFIPSGSLGNWLPGSTPLRLPKGTGRLMPARSDLVLQMHYQCTGKVEFDQSTIGIYFADSSARRVVSEFQVLNSQLKIPAGAKRYKQHAELRLPVGLTLFDAAPHMHLLGREMKVTARLPTGKKLPLIWIKDWDFNWQGQYMFRKPLRLPKGTRILVDAWLDNSSSNPLNPSSPPKTAYWGEQTDDEMPLCQFRFTTRSRRELLIMNQHYRRRLKAAYEEEKKRHRQRRRVSENR